MVLLLISQTILADTVLVSIDKDHFESSNNSSRRPSISEDGRYIAFDSRASNLVDNDINGYTDIFVHDMQTGITRLINFNSDGGPANNHSDESSISADGRYIVFKSYATNLVDNDTNGTWDIFIHDIQTGITRLISVNSSGKQANDRSYNSSISADGRYIAFRSYASNLVDNDNNEEFDIFVNKGYSLSGELWGLPYRDRIVIQNNHIDTLELTANGPFELILGSANYSLAILEQPQRANCMIYNPMGTIGQVRPIVRCFSRRYR